MDSLELIRPAKLDPADAGYVEVTHKPLGYGDYTPRMLGPKYPAHDSTAPIFDGKDLAGLIAGAAITLGPLAAYAFGFGL